MPSKQENNVELVKAILSQDLSRVEELINSGADVNGLTDRYNYIDQRIKKELQLVSPLIAAISVKNLQIVEFLLEKGADINLPAGIVTTPYTEACRQFALDAASSMGHEEELESFKILDKLASKHKPEFNPQTYKTPLIEAVEANSASVFLLDYLVDKGAGLNFVSKAGANPLICMMRRMYLSGEQINKELFVHFLSLKDLDFNPKTSDSVISILLQSSCSVQDIQGFLDKGVKVKENDLSFALKRKKITEFNFLKDKVDFSSYNIYSADNIILQIVRLQDLDLAKEILSNKVLEARITKLTSEDSEYLISVFTQAQIPIGKQWEFLSLLEKKGFAYSPTQLSQNDIKSFIHPMILSKQEAQSYLNILSKDQEDCLGVFTKIMEMRNKDLIFEILKKKFVFFTKFMQSASSEFQEAFKVFCKDEGIYYSGKFGNLLLKAQVHNENELYGSVLLNLKVNPDKKLRETTSSKELQKLSKTHVGLESKLYDINDKVIPDGEYMYVANKKGELYVQKIPVQNFYHSFFLKGKEGDKHFGMGKPIACAGDLTVEGGKIVGIKNNSGHYQPTADHLFLLAIELEKSGVLDNNVDIKYFTPRGFKTVKLKDAKKHIYEHFDEIFQSYPEYKLSTHTPTVTEAEFKYTLAKELEFTGDYNPTETFS